jgi:hypothetical protein|eukprot:COSAG06_NODE_1294_length_9970_cov_3.420120_12_plen_98_part_00
MSKLVRKLEEQKKEMWAKRLSVRKYVDQKFLRSRGRDRAKIEEMRKLLEEWTGSEPPPPPAAPPPPTALPSPRPPRQMTQRRAVTLHQARRPCTWEI